MMPSRGTLVRLFPRLNPLRNSIGRRFPTVTKVVLSTQPDTFPCRVLPSRFLGDGIQRVAALGQDAWTGTNRMTQCLENSTLSVLTSRVKQNRPLPVSNPETATDTILDGTIQELLLRILTLKVSISCAPNTPLTVSWSGPVSGRQTLQTIETNNVITIVKCRSRTRPKTCDPKFCTGWPQRGGQVRSSRLLPDRQWSGIP